MHSYSTFIETAHVIVVSTYVSGNNTLDIPGTNIRATNVITTNTGAIATNTLINGISTNLQPSHTSITEEEPACKCSPLSSFSLHKMGRDHKKILT